MRVDDVHSIHFLSVSFRCEKVQRKIYLWMTVSKDDHEDTLLCACTQACNRTHTHAQYKLVKNVSRSERKKAT